MVIDTTKQMDPYSPEGCFIATATYGTEAHPKIDLLREFRDEFLKENYFGRLFVKAYYRLSPPVADYVAAKEARREKVRKLLVEPLCKVVEKVL